MDIRPVKTDHLAHYPDDLSQILFGECINQYDSLDLGAAGPD
jgi:hypothetical protein